MAGTRRERRVCMCAHEAQSSCPATVFVKLLKASELYGSARCFFGSVVTKLTRTYDFARSPFPLVLSRSGARFAHSSRHADDADADAVLGAGGDCQELSGSDPDVRRRAARHRDRKSVV